MTDEEAASWRYWTTLLGRIRFGKQKVAGKTLSGMVIKAVGERIATYADRDGSRVRPGIARIAVDLETSHTTVRNAITVLERVGLLRLETKANRNHAAVYQLVISAEVIENAELWSPDRYAAEIRTLSLKYQGRGPLEGSPTPTASVNDGISLTPQASVIEENDLCIADAVGSGKTAIADAVGCLSLTPEGSATNQRLNHKSDQPSDEDSRTQLASSRAHAQDPDSQDLLALAEPSVNNLVSSGAVTFLAASSSVSDPQDPPAPFEPKREPCPHGNSSRIRRDGKPRCDTCRTEAELAAAVADVHLGPARCEHGLKIARNKTGEVACFACRRGIPA